MKHFLTAVLSLLLTYSYGQSINNRWQQDLNKELEQFKACDTTIARGINPCNMYVGKTLKTIYQIDDFYLKEQERYMLISEMSEFLKNNKKWTLLSYGYEQKALTEAQNYANSKKAVVAIYLNKEGIGHLSIITPGELKTSGLWGYMVPNSTSFFLNKPDLSYMDKGLSYAFSRNMIMGVLIYGRNY